MINLLGSWASIIGIPLTIIGLIIAIREASKSSNASNSARRAVEQFRKELMMVDLVSELTKAISGLQDVKRLLRNNAFGPIPDRLADIRHTLIGVRASRADYSKEQELIFQDAVSEFRSLETKFEKCLFENNTPRNISRITNIISEKIDNLQSILIVIKKDIGKE